jgi:hypothetical protein
MYQTDATDGFAAVILWILGIVASWLFIYTAVRAAVGHCLDRRRPLLQAVATARPEAVRLAITNTGSGPAFDVSVRWQDELSTLLAGTPLLAPGSDLDVDLAVRAVEGETQIVRFLKVEGRHDLDSDPSSRFSERRAVLVPSRLAPTS